MQKIKFLSAGLLFMAFAACGNNQSASNTDTTAAATPAATPAAPDTNAAAATPAPQGPNSFVVEANDQMQYNVTALSAKAGQPITITLKNVGKLPKEAMGHDLVVLKPGTNVQAYITDAAQAKATDYVPASQAANIVAHTKLLGPGESDAITFTLKPGVYEYLCSFPGHAATMNGKLTVQ
jgi:azurin